MFSDKTEIPSKSATISYVSFNIEIERIDYISSENKQTDRPMKLLKGFARTSVTAGEAKKVSVNVELDDIKFYNPESGEWELDPAYTVYIGTDSRNVISAGRIEIQR